ncbi:Hypothetical protein A7982_07610 [Minicystis rosea]|nr:Hypothetical protein A7982_07610 [Minicystis rosea]
MGLRTISARREERAAEVRSRDVPACLRAGRLDRGASRSYGLGPCSIASMSA